VRPGAQLFGQVGQHRDSYLHCYIVARKGCPSGWRPPLCGIRLKSGWRQELPLACLQDVDVATQYGAIRPSELEGRRHGFARRAQS
jgi:hypothetical protein